MRVRLVLYLVFSLTLLDLASCGRCCNKCKRPKPKPNPPSGPSKVSGTASSSASASASSTSNGKSSASASAASASSSNASGGLSSGSALSTAAAGSGTDQISTTALTEVNVSSSATSINTRDEDSSHSIVKTDSYTTRKTITEPKSEASIIPTLGAVTESAQSLTKNTTTNEKLDSIPSYGLTQGSTANAAATASADATSTGGIILGQQTPIPYGTSGSIPSYGLTQGSTANAAATAPSFSFATNRFAPAFSTSGFDLWHLLRIVNAYDYKTFGHYLNELDLESLEQALLFLLTQAQSESQAEALAFCLGHALSHAKTQPQQQILVNALTQAQSRSQSQFNGMALAQAFSQARSQPQAQVYGQPPPVVYNPLPSVFPVGVHQITPEEAALVFQLSKLIQECNQLQQLESILKDYPPLIQEVLSQQIMAKIMDLRQNQPHLQWIPPPRLAPAPLIQKTPGPTSSAPYVLASLGPAPPTAAIPVVPVPNGNIELTPLAGPY